MDWASLFATGLGSGVDPETVGLGFGMTGGQGLQAPMSALQLPQAAAPGLMMDPQKMMLMKALGSMGQQTANVPMLQFQRTNQTIAPPVQQFQPIQIQPTLASRLAR